MTGELERGLTTSVSLGVEQIQRLVVAAESLADDQADFDPEFAAALQSDADALRRAASAGTVPADDEGEQSTTAEFTAALDD
ncbi:hypothetical protein [Candidatus Halobonum tyrrellensis]|uniref:Uncharacterized protein n=1 Tax=Candidatus Halobonum tyrrellensis G22 TaxID=1324957 RepID=V4HDF2_9EURY|nr:hypothetical protein [Candidatus Halobonum tyrrellensis]ESP88098.1 hypothetical protein K933_10422 [Candidatus Halobonum tyrrellensis G22]